VFNLPMVASTVTLVATGPGSLFNITISSGGLFDFAVCYDSASVTGITSTFVPTTDVPELSRVFVITNAIQNVGIGVTPSGTPLIVFTNGLVCSQSAAQRSKIYYRQPD